MKLTIQLTTGILAMAMMAGAAWAQSPDAIDNARSTAKSLQQTQANPAPKAATVPAAAKPKPGAPASAAKPAAVAAKPASSSHNQLERVNVVPAAGGLQIEISSTQAVTPQVTKLTSPDRLLVELPGTVVATAQNKIPVGTAGVKGVRIGMDGKTPPTTSVVVDLTQPLSYELTPGAAGKVVLTLHSQGAAPSVAKNAPAPAKAAPVKASAPATQSQAAAKTAPALTKVAAVKEPATKPALKPRSPSRNSPPSRLHRLRQRPLHPRRPLQR